MDAEYNSEHIRVGQRAHTQGPVRSLQGQLPPLSSFASSCDPEATGKAGLASERSPLFQDGCPSCKASQQVSLLLLVMLTPGPVGGFSGHPSPRWGAGASWSWVWSQEWNRGTIELPTELPPGRLRAPRAGTREAHASLGGVAALGTGPGL